MTASVTSGGKRPDPGGARVARRAAAVAALLWLAGCGQKGALSLPAPAPAASAAASR